MDLFNLPVCFYVYNPTWKIWARNQLEEKHQAWTSEKTTYFIIQIRWFYWMCLIQILYSLENTSSTLFITSSTFYLWTVHEQNCNPSTCLDSLVRKPTGQKLELDSKNKPRFSEGLRNISIKSLEAVWDVVLLASSLYIMFRRTWQPNLLVNYGTLINLRMPFSKNYIIFY